MASGRTGGTLRTVNNRTRPTATRDAEARIGPSHFAVCCLASVPTADWDCRVLGRGAGRAIPRQDPAQDTSLEPRPVAVRPMAMHATCQMGWMLAPMDSETTVYGNRTLNNTGTTSTYFNPGSMRMPLWRMCCTHRRGSFGTLSLHISLTRCHPPQLQSRTPEGVAQTRPSFHVHAAGRDCQKGTTTLPSLRHEAPWKPFGGITSPLLSAASSGSAASLAAKAASS